jgi:glycosyltransferase involved in cell wall biosynthesis
MIDRKVAVVIPLYNHEKYIEHALKSVVDQSYPVSEIVIVDDGSTDRSFKIAKELLGQKEGVVLKHQKNSGTASALNNAIAAASCEWIAVLNSDDIFEVDKIERCLYIAASNPNIEIISGNIDFIDHNGTVVEDGVSRDWLKRSFAYYQKTMSLPLSILNENFIATSSNTFFKRALWERVGGFRDYRYCNDLDFLIRCFEYKTFYFDIEHKHLRYRTHSSNTIAEDIARVRLERAFVTMKHLARLKVEDAQVPFLFEAIRNLQLGEMMFILNLISNPGEEDFLDWLKVREIFQDKGLLKMLNF